MQKKVKPLNTKPLSLKAELYQVVVTLADMAGVFDTKDVIEVLDVLCGAKKHDKSFLPLTQLNQRGSPSEPQKIHSLYPS